MSREEDFIQRLDLDGDNRVSAEEFDGPPGHFADFDLSARHLAVAARRPLLAHEAFHDVTGPGLQVRAAEGDIDLAVEAADDDA